MDFISLPFFYGKGKRKEILEISNSSVDHDIVKDKDIKIKGSMVQPITSDSKKRKLTLSVTTQVKKKKHRLSNKLKINKMHVVSSRPDKMYSESIQDQAENWKNKNESNKFFKNTPDCHRSQQKHCYRGISLPNKNKKRSKFAPNLFKKMSHTAMHSLGTEHHDQSVDNVPIDGMVKAFNAGGVEGDSDVKIMEDDVLDCQNSAQNHKLNTEALSYVPTSAEKKVQHFTQLKLTGDSLSLMQSDHCFIEPSPATEQNIFKSPRRTSRNILIKTKEKSQQMLLDFGQKMDGPVQCNLCGLTYNAYERSDEKFHAKYHKKCLSILRYNISSKDRILQSYSDGGVVIVVGEGSQTKVEEIRKHVDSELGFVTENLHSALCQVFLYVRDNQAIGFCMAQVIKQGYRMISPTRDTCERTDVISVDMGRESLGRGQPYCCSTTPEPAKCGINRIWVVGKERRNGVATRLLDVVRNHFSFGRVLSRADLAFSDPTTDGTALASKYVGFPNFLVYNNYHQ